MTFFWPTGHVGMLHPFSSNKHARDRAVDFAKLAGAAKAGTPYSLAKDLLAVKQSQAETRLAFFAEIGLIYVVPGSDNLTLTPVGNQLLSAINDTQTTDDAKKVASTRILAWALSNSQIRRPVSPGSPKISEADRNACNIRPYSVFWKLVQECDGKLYLHELLGPVARIKLLSDVAPCVAKVMDARKAKTVFVDASHWASGQPLMNAAIYWKSHLSIANELLEFDSSDQSFQFKTGSKELVSLIDHHQLGGGKAPLLSLAARNWGTVDEYFAFAGKKCPAEILGFTIDDEHEEGKSALDEFAEVEAIEPEVPFDPTDAEDGRKRVLAEVIRRQGQKKFRKGLLDAYSGKCAMTGCDEVCVLEAAHISPYQGPDTNKADNGLLLRADIHTLFDLGLMSVNPDTLTIRVSQQVEAAEYRALDGITLRKSKVQPSKAALQEHWDRSTP